MEHVEWDVGELFAIHGVLFMIVRSKMEMQMLEA